MGLLEHKYYIYYTRIVINNNNNNNNDYYYTIENSQLTFFASHFP